MSEQADQQPLSWQHNAEIAVPSPKHERRLAIREVDWSRLKRAMQQIQKPLPTFSFIYSALIGVAVSAGLTIIPLLYSQGLPSWVVPLYALLTFFCVLVSACLYIIERAFLKRQREDATGALEDMTDIERHFPTDPNATPNDRNA